MRRAAAIASLLGLVLAGCGGSSSSSSSSSGGGQTAVHGPLIGTMFDGPVVGGQVDLAKQMDLAVGSGAESLRVTVPWSTVEPFPNLSAVPPPARSAFPTLVGGVPASFTAFDRIVSLAAQRHLQLLPVVLSTPGWANGGRSTAVPPSSPSTYATFVSGLVHRYGPSGSFWSSHPSLPKVPIRSWQIWNEPNFTRYWTTQPFPASYVQLLRAAHDAIKVADPGAQVVMAGFPEFSWESVAQIYAEPGAKGAFDAVAVHPYTARPQGVIKILGLVRQAMDRAGDSAKPIIATEITWPSSQGKAPPQFGVGTTEAQQATLLGQVMPLLAANQHRLGLSGIYWYTWMGDETPRTTSYGFDYAGLLKYVSGTVTAKPALAVYKQWALKLEGCASKTTSAATCG